MKIIKIGGTALSNISNIIDFTNTLNHSNRPILLVISAFGKLSSALKNFDFTPIISKKSSPFHFFREFSSILTDSECVKFFTYLDKVEIILTKRAKGITISGEFPARVMDEILSFGELVSSYFVHCLLNSINIENEFVDSRELIITDSDFGVAKLDLAESIARIQKQKFYSGVIVTQGFIASDLAGNTTTMGFESSNLSATVFANALDSSEIEIVTKVNHIYSANPDLNTSAKPVYQIPYTSAKTLANNGFKMLFPGMIDLAEKKRIKLIYRGINNTEVTIISEEVQFEYPVILAINKGYVVSPITSANALKILGNFETGIDEFSYNRYNHSLIINANELDERELHDFAISLF